MSRTNRLESVRAWPGAGEPEGWSPAVAPTSDGDFSLAI